MPKAIDGFANYITPNLSSKTTKEWYFQYTVGGNINLANARKGHLAGTILIMSALTVKAGGKLTIPDSDITVQYTGTADSIVRETGETEEIGETDGQHNIHFVPCVDVKFYDSTGKEFPKGSTEGSTEDVYQIPDDQKVTIVAVISANKVTASLGTAPAATQANPSVTPYASASPKLGTYAFAFVHEVYDDPSDPSNSSKTNEYKYYADGALTISTSTINSDNVTTLKLTLSAEQFAAYKGYDFFVSNQGVTGGNNVPPKYTDAFSSVSFACKSAQPVTINNVPTTVTYGDADFPLSATGSGTGAVTWSSDKTDVATVDSATGAVTVKAAGTVTITAVKAEDADYFAGTGNYTITVNKKAPTAENLTVTPAENLVFDNSAKAAIVTAKIELTGFGTVNSIYYTGVAPTVYTKSTTAPTNAGTYSVSVDIAAGANYAAATNLAVGQFTIAKAENIAAPTGGVVDDTANTFTFTKVSGYDSYQFSLDGGTTWKDCVDIDKVDGTVTISVGNIARKVKVRVKETDNYVGQALESSAFTATLEGTVSISGTAKYGQTLTATVTGAQENAALSYQWKQGGTDISGAANPTLVLEKAELVGQTITVVVTASSYTGTLTSTATNAVAKADSVVTTWPTAAAITYGQTLANAALSGAVLADGTTGTFAFNVPETKPSASATPRSFEVTFTPTNPATHTTLTQMVSVTVNKATLTAEGTASATADYGTKLKDIPITGLTAKSNGTEVSGAWAFSGETILNVGNSTAYTATFTPADGASNYDALTAEITPTIHKIAYPGTAISPTKNVRINQAQTGVEVDLSTLLSGIVGASVTAASEGTDTNDLVSNVTTNGNKIAFDVARVAQTEKTAAINVTIASTNYTDITAVITVHTVDKDEANVTLTGTVPTAKTYGNATFQVTASAANAGTGTGVWTWTSSDPTVLEVTGTTATATVKILKAGYAALTVKYESDTAIGEAATASIAVGKATITIKAGSKSIYVGDAVPSLTAPVKGTDYTVTGLAGTDALGGTITMKYQQSGVDATPDASKTGTYDIVISGATIPSGDNYDSIVFQPGTLTISQKPSGGGGGNGGGGGGATTPSTGTTPTVTAPSNGTLTDSSVTSAITSAGKGGEININASASTSANISGTAALAVANNGSALNVTVKNGGEITLQPDVLQGLNLKAADKVAVGMTAATGSTATAPSFEVNLTLNGANVHNLDGSMSISFPVNTAWNGLSAIVEHRHADGSVTYTKAIVKDGKATASVTDLSTFTVRLASDMPAAAFTDVAESAYYYGAVNWAVEKGVTSGTSATTFSPDMTCTRAQTVTFLWRAMGSPEPTATVNPFTDVSADAYYYKAVLWAVEKGITSGTSATTFSPDAVCSRSQVVTLLWRAEGSPVVNYAMSFTDVAADSYYAEAVRWAVSEGITSGTGATIFSPAADCSRAQIVTFLYRGLGK